MYRPYWNYYRTFDDTSKPVALVTPLSARVAIGILFAIYAFAVLALFWSVS